MKKLLNNRLKIFLLFYLMVCKSIASTVFSVFNPSRPPTIINLSLYKEQPNCNRLKINLKINLEIKHQLL